MTLKYEKNKHNILKWRQNETNMQRQLEINKLYKRKYDEWKRTIKIYMAILL
jgi:hypothetical protein